MIQLTLVEVDAQVQQLPDGTRVLALRDSESGILILAPFPEEAAKAIGGELASGVTVASEMPKPTLVPFEKPVA